MCIRRIAIPITVVFLLISFLFVISGCGQKQEAATAKQEQTQNKEPEKIVLKVAVNVNETHHLFKEGVKVFGERAEKLSNGRLKFDYYLSGTLGKDQEMIDLLNKGVCDIGNTHPTYNTGLMPLCNVATLPGAAPDAGVATRVLNQLVKDKNSIFYKIDFERNNIIPLIPNAQALYEIVTTKKAGPVKTMEDVKGLKLRSGGGMLDEVCKLLGAVPVMTTATEQYDALARGTVDGGVFNLPAVIPNRVCEVAKYSTYGAAVGSFVCTWSVSKRVWEKLPDWAKEAITKAADEATENQASYLEKAVPDVRKELEQKWGWEFYELPVAEKERIHQALSSAWDKWEKDLNGRGLPGTEAVKVWREAIKNYKGK
ncbi:MAG: hypothetical protein PWP65_616 [Clostridia bacterium]|nr:hypothetical protein [Clostridia bacterium]